MREKASDIEEEMKDKVGYNMSFSQRELTYIKELEKANKKNGMNEVVIS